VLMFLLHVLENLHIKFSLQTFSLLKAIANLVEQKISQQPLNPQDEATVIGFIYDELPKKFKAPNGPVTQAELEAVIQGVIKLYQASLALVK